jgi:hypothetical protein
MLLGSAVLAGLVSSSAMAGIVLLPGAAVAFAADTAVPLDAWSSVLACAMIAIAAYFLLRRQGSFGRLWQWTVLAVGTGAAIAGLRQVDLISSASALPALPGLSFPSPNFIIVPCNGSPIQVPNSTGQLIHIVSVTWTGIGSCGPAISTTPTCAPGVPLAAGASCYLQLDPPSPSA